MASARVVCLRPLSLSPCAPSHLTFLVPRRLLCQAAHRSAEVGAKLSPVPSDFSAAPVGGGGSMASSHLHSGRKYAAPHSGIDGEGSRSSNAGAVENGVGHQHHPRPTSMSNLEVPLPCLRPFGRRASRPDAAVLLYAVGTAVREAMPVWLLAGAQVGGMGASTLRVGAVFAAGVLIGEAGRWCCCAPLRRGGDGDEAGAGRRLSRAAWARLASAAILGLLYLLSTLLSSPSSAYIPREVLWLAVTVVIAANHASLGLCTAAAAASVGARSRHQLPAFVSSNGGDLVAGGGLRPSPAPPRAASLLASGSILFVGDVLGSAAGPSVLGLAMWTGCGSPLDASLWLVLCLCGDLWLVVAAREAEPRHARLLGGEDAADEEEEEDERRRSRRFAQFV